MLARDAKKTAQANIKKEEVLNCEMENAELRFTDMRSNAAVERLFSAAGLILDAKRSKLDPAWVDHILFLREAFLLGTCKLEWE